MVADHLIVSLFHFLGQGAFARAKLLKLVHLISRDGLPRLGLEQFGPIWTEERNLPPLLKPAVGVATHSCLLSESPRQHTDISVSDSKVHAEKIYPVAA